MPAPGMPKSKTFAGSQISEASAPQMMGKASPPKRPKAEEARHKLSQYQPLGAQEWLEKLDEATKEVVKAD